MRKRSIALLIATVLSTAYVIYLICYFTGATTTTSGEEQIGGAIAAAIVAPHMIFIGIGVIFGWLGYLLKAGWAALAGAILYAIGMILFLPYIMFGAPITILGFVGFAMQRKLNKKNQLSNSEFANVITWFCSWLAIY